MIIVLYLIKMIFISGLFYTYYWFFLRNKQFHHYNRFYLLGIVPASAILPLEKIPVAFSGFTNYSSDIRLLKVTNGDWETPVTIIANKSFIKIFMSWQYLSFLVYAIVALVLFVILLKSLFYINKITRLYTFERINDIHFFQTNEPGTPFSFFKKIFWNNKLDLESREGQQVFRHELYHVRQHHTADILFLEFLGILTWFNPFIYLIKKEIKAIHEFLADRYAVSNSNMYAYAELLVIQSIRHSKSNIVNPFFHNQIKRRIAMITKLQYKKHGYISRIMILPFFFILFCAFAIKAIDRKPAAQVEKTITVVIDAGHGGVDPGVTGPNGVSEKDIALQISKKIQSLSKTYNVHVVMTREKDELPGGTLDYKTGLNNRTEIAVKSKADLFISIHMNNTNDQSKSGFQMYISDKDPGLVQKNVQLGSILSEEIKKDYAVEDALIRMNHGVAVLNHSAIPAIIVECGYMTNSKDLAFILDEQNQEKIAKDILEGIVRFENSYGYEQPGTSTEKDPLVSSLNHYLLKHIHYPESLLEKNMIGTLDAEFILDEKGVYKEINFLPSLPKDIRTVSINVYALSKYKGTDHTVSKSKFGRSETAQLQEEIRKIVSGYQYASAGGISNKVHLHISFDIEKSDATCAQKK